MIGYVVVALACFWAGWILCAVFAEACSCYRRTEPDPPSPWLLQESRNPVVFDWDGPGSEFGRGVLQDGTQPERMRG